MAGPLDEQRPVLSSDPMERRYANRNVRVRMHQGRFRGIVLPAYRDQCAMCRLKEARLLDAAHIVGDLEEQGEPVVSNGLSLCSIHHRAFDHDLIGVSPDYRVHVSRKLLEDEDGPMLDRSQDRAGCLDSGTAPCGVPTGPGAARHPLRALSASELGMDVKIFNLNSDEWDRTEEREGWRMQGRLGRCAHRRRADRREHVRGRAGKQAGAVPHAPRERGVGDRPPRRADASHARGRAAAARGGRGRLPPRQGGRAPDPQRRPIRRSGCSCSRR